MARRQRVCRRFRWLDSSLTCFGAWRRFLFVPFRFRVDRTSPLWVSANLVFCYPLPTLGPAREHTCRIITVPSCVADVNHVNSSFKRCSETWVWKQGRGFDSHCCSGALLAARLILVGAFLRLGMRKDDGDAGGWPEYRPRRAKTPHGTARDRSKTPGFQDGTTVDQSNQHKKYITDRVHLTGGIAREYRWGISLGDGWGDRCEHVVSVLIKACSDSNHG